MPDFKRSILKRNPTVTVGEAFDILNINAEDMYDQIYAKMPPEDRAEIDRVRLNLESQFHNFGKMRSKELIVKLSIYLANGGQRANP